MTQPAVTTSKAKAYVAMVGGLLTVVIPLVIQLQSYLPPQWQAIIGGAVALLTVFGVYKTPNKVVVPTNSTQPATQPAPYTPPAGGDQNPWA